MPIYELALKDGRKFDVEGPEGATDAQLAALLNQQLSAPDRLCRPHRSTDTGKPSRC